ALGPDSPVFAAIQQLVDTASGRGFDSDAFQSRFETAVRDARPGVIAPFIHANAGTSGLAKTALRRAEADAFARTYDSERSRQLGAASALPSVAAIPYGLLSEIGGQQQELGQRGI